MTDKLRGGPAPVERHHQARHPDPCGQLPALRTGQTSSSPWSGHAEQALPLRRSTGHAPRRRSAGPGHVHFSQPRGHVPLRCCHTGTCPRGSGNGHEGICHSPRPRERISEGGRHRGGMSTEVGGSRVRRACPLVGQGRLPGHEPWAGAARRGGGGTCLAATTSGSGITTSACRVRTVHSASRARHQLAQRVRQAALDPVPDHYAGAKAGGGQELLGRGHRGTHQFILGPVDSRVRTRVTPG